MGSIHRLIHGGLSIIVILGIFGGLIYCIWNQPPQTSNFPDEGFFQQSLQWSVTNCVMKTPKPRFFFFAQRKGHHYLLDTVDGKTPHVTTTTSTNWGRFYWGYVRFINYGGPLLYR